MERRCKSGLRRASLGLILALLAAVTGWGAETVSVQGLLKSSDGVPLASGAYNIKFSMFDVASGGSALWAEPHSGANNVAVTQGLFAVELGSLTAFPGDLFGGHENLWVEVAVDMDGNGTYEEVFGPRLKLGAAPYAKKAEAVTGGAKYDAMVAPSGGDYTTIQAALAAGKKTIFVRDGTYVLTSDIDITEDGTAIIGESRDGVIIDSNNSAYGIVAIGDTAILSDATQVSISNGTKTVTGSGTSWMGKVSPGEYIMLGYEWYKIQTVNSDTQLTLVETYHGRTLSGQGYQIASLLANLRLENLTVRRYSEVDHGGIDWEYVLNSTIENCAVTNSSTYGIYVIGYYCRLDKNEVRHNGTGIRIFGWNNSLCENSCSNNAQDGIYLWGPQSSVSGNACDSNGENGIHVDFGSRNSLTGNTCKYNASNGVILDSASENCVQGNTCSFNGNDGIYLYYYFTFNNVVNGNTCNSNGAYGIAFYSGPIHNTASGNSCAGNGSGGIRINASSRNSLLGNIATSNTNYGISVINSSSENNIVTGNMMYWNSGGAGFDGGTGTIKANNYPSF
jgi:parallel beta-helix repeat protein